MTGILLLTLLFASQDFLAEGLKALDDDKPAIAEPLLREAVKAKPDDYFAHFNLALALSLQYKDDDAIAEYRTALQQKPGLYETSLNLGIVLLRTKTFAEALPVLRDAAAAKPNDATPNFYYAQALFETGEIGQAKEHYLISATADPKSARAQLGLGRCFLAESNFTEAAKYFHTAASLDLDYKNNLLDLAAAYEKARQIPEAIAIYRDFPENAAAKQRIAELERFQASSIPDPFDERMNRGKSLRDEHKYVPAANEFLAATKIHPDSLPAWKELAAALVISKNFPEAIAALDRAKALAPETPGQLYYRAISLDSLKQHKPAIEAYRSFLALDGGKLPDQEFLARQRIRIIESEMQRR
jgi:tetratricopeptide (TPR) repeat protein